MILNVDFAPTLLDAAGAEGAGRHAGPQLPAALEGREAGGLADVDVLPLLPLPACTTSVQPHYGVRTERYKLIYFNKINQWELYDLKKDPQRAEQRLRRPGLRRDGEEAQGRRCTG